MLDSRVFLIAEMVEFALKEKKDSSATAIKGWIYMQMNAINDMDKNVVEAGVKLYKQHPDISKKIWRLSFDRFLVV